MQPLTAPGTDSRYPAWTSNSKRIAFQSSQGGDLAIWWQAADGTDKATRLTTPLSKGVSHIPESWSADGTLLYSVTTNSIAELWTLPVRNGKADPPRRFGRSISTDPMSAVLSPKGNLVAYTRTDEAGTTVCVEPFPSANINVCLPPNGADTPKHPRWSPDGRRLFYDPRPGDFEWVEVLTEPELRMGTRVPVAYHPFRLAPLGGRTPFDILRTGEFVGLIPQGQDEYVTRASRTITVVHNWFEVLRKKMTQ